MSDYVHTGRRSRVLPDSVALEQRLQRSGRSLLALVAGARAIQQGHVQALGGDMASVAHRNAVCPRIAYMPQGLGRNLYPTLSVEENLQFFAKLFGHDAAERRRREVAPTLSVLRESLLANAKTPEDAFAQQRMREMHELVDLANNWFDDLQRLSPESLALCLRPSQNASTVPFLVTITEGIR